MCVHVHMCDAYMYARLLVYVYLLCLYIHLNVMIHVLKLVYYVVASMDVIIYMYTSHTAR